MALSDQAQISLITVLPGDYVYSLFGHSAIRVYDPVRGFDAQFNYGTFNFTGTFVFEFAYGKLDYLLDIESYPAALDYYSNVEGRSVIEQVLNLNATQRDTLFQFLRTNALPENRAYRYDFFFDNCATRIREALETVFGEAVHFAPEPNPDLSFRRLLDPYLVEQPALHLLMDLGLGAPADQIASPREATYLPDFLSASFGHATISDGATTRPLIARTDTVYWSAKNDVADPAWPWPTIGGWLLLAIVTILTFQDVRAARAERRAIDGTLYGVLGVAGLLLIFLWFISLHTVTQQNYNLLWIWPTHLLPAVALIRRSKAQWPGWYLGALSVAAVIMLVGWPFWPQDIPAAVLPLVLVVLVRSTGLMYIRLKPRALQQSQDAKSTRG